MSTSASDKIAATMRKFMDDGHYKEAARYGEAAAIEAHDQTLNAAYFALLTAAHIGSATFAAARLAVVRGVAESGDKSLEFLPRLLSQRQDGNYANAIGALKSAPADVVDLFRDILICELAAITAAMENPAHIDHVCKVSGEDSGSVKDSIQRKGRGFGVEMSEKGDGSLSRCAKPVHSENSSGSTKKEIASVDLITEAALMTAENVDRYWRN